MHVNSVTVALTVGFHNRGIHSFVEKGGKKKKSFSETVSTIKFLGKQRSCHHHILQRFRREYFAFAPFCASLRGLVPDNGLGECLVLFVPGPGMSQVFIPTRPTAFGFELVLNAS